MAKSEPEMILVVSRDQIQSRIKSLAEELSKFYTGRNLVMVGVLKGAFIFMADIVRNMSIPVSVEFVRLASYGAGTASSGTISMSKDVEMDLTGRDVLIVEDIVDSGLTLNWLKKRLAEKGAASVSTCVLVDKPERRDIEVELEFVGFNIPKGFLIGYGLDYNEQYRHLPEIYHLVTV